MSVCGIAGIATDDGLMASEGPLLDRMLQALAHRGPDEQFSVADSHAAIGTRRLSIIDLDTGRQPIANEDGTVHVTQNGEIYNYLELREQLERRGHRFRTQGDTETIVHLYEEYEDRFVDHLRGMYAVALWDSRRRRLVLARDRLGKKPLYWRLHRNRLTYGSELKAILCDPTVERTMDRTALAQYLQYQYVPAPRSILAGINKLPPASVLTWNGGEPTVRRYWTPEYLPKTNRSPEEDRGACLALLKESVRLRMRSDVPVGVFLSGGMDSSTIVALLADLGVGQIRTFSIGFDDPAYNELPYARAVAQQFGTQHTEEVVRMDAISLLPELADHYDEPFGDSSAIPTFRLAEVAARDVRVVLTGDGGDEVFGGYDRYRFQLTMALLDRIPPRLRRTALRSAQLVMSRTETGRRLRRRAASLNRLADLPRDQRYVRLMSTFDSQLRAALLADTALANQDAYLVDILESGSTEQLDRVLRADTLSYLPEDLLVKMDRATMANSLEARAPLLDHKLVELMASMPTSRKIRHLTSKVLLREIALTLLPKPIVGRPKKGFGVPLTSWFRGDLGERFQEVVLSPQALLREHMNQEVAGSLLAEHRAGREEHGHRLWSLLMFELWAQRWLRAEPKDLS